MATKESAAIDELEARHARTARFVDLSALWASEELREIYQDLEETRVMIQRVRELAADKGNEIEMFETRWLQTIRSDHYLGSCAYMDLASEDVFAELKKWTACTATTSASCNESGHLLKEAVETTRNAVEKEIAFTDARSNIRLERLERSQAFSDVHAALEVEARNLETVRMAVVDRVEQIKSTFCRDLEFERKSRYERLAGIQELLQQLESHITADRV